MEAAEPMEAEQRTAGEASTSGSSQTASAEKPIVVLVIGEPMQSYSSSVQQQQQKDRLHYPLSAAQQHSGVRLRGC
jgi:hypothetical protein